MVIPSGPRYHYILAYTLNFQAQLTFSRTFKALCASTLPPTDPKAEVDPATRNRQIWEAFETLGLLDRYESIIASKLQVLLAQRLLSITGEDTDEVEKERRNIEILQIFFGEAALQVCKVMLKDMTDSKRIDAIPETLYRAPDHHITAFLALLGIERYHHAWAVPKLQEQYWKEFTIFKPDKKRWLPHLGTIHLELQLEDRTIEADVPPLEAAFIELFSSKSSQSPFSDFKASLRMHFSHLDSRRAYSRRGVGQPDCRAKRIPDLGGPEGEDDMEDTFRLLEIAEEPCSLGGADSEKRHHLSSILLHLLSARHTIFLPPLPLKNPVRASYGPVDAPTTAPPTQACPLVRLERSLGICEGEGDACRHAMADKQLQVNGVHEEDDEVGVRGEGGGVGVHVPEGGEALLKGGWERSAAQAWVRTRVRWAAKQNVGAGDGGWVKEKAAEGVCLDFGAWEAGGEDCEAPSYPHIWRGAFPEKVQVLRFSQLVTFIDIPELKQIFSQNHPAYFVCLSSSRPPPAASTSTSTPTSINNNNDGNSKLAAVIATVNHLPDARRAP
ncbi:hypothetical protein D9615_010472 [Tricholomella constricta]|uniref:Uncharacterized protein n=1 Tax=Tricholomella constricta TaxID=117010 RepID=A0A8H5LSF4_9AGAR|nr:hypothetical protein D9615_010472 [Tricholomella constricta]